MCDRETFFGTTATHAAVLYAKLGQAAADDFFTRIADNAVVVSGNKQVAINVSRGKFAFGLTDTDDAIIEMEQGNPVAIVFPDQGDDQPGTLLIPNTLCVLRNGPNKANAEKLLDYLLQKQIGISVGKGGECPNSFAS